MVIYDAADEECPLEFRLGSEDLGRVEPQRHDNRRHLIVLEQPVVFREEMEVFQVIAPGSGTYRIESFALLAQRPTPSVFEPRIERLSARLAERIESSAAVELHFTTTEPARCSVRATLSEKAHGDRGRGSATGPLSREKDYRKLHAFATANLLPDRTYVFEVEAVERGGARSRKSIDFATAMANDPMAHSDLSIPIEMIRQNGGAAEVPLTFGLPLPEGRQRGKLVAFLEFDDERSEVQIKTHSRWPDGTARWVLLNAVTPAVGGGGQRHKGRVVISAGSDSETTSIRPKEWYCENETGDITATGDFFRLRVERRDRGFPLRLDARILEGENDKGWRPVWGAPDDEQPTPDWMTAVLANGLVLRPDAMEDLAVEEAGPHRVSVRFRIASHRRSE